MSRILLLAGLVLLAALAPRGAAAEGTVAVLDIKGAIGPATSADIHRGFAKAKERNAKKKAAAKDKEKRKKNRGKVDVALY